MKIYTKCKQQFRVPWGSSRLELTKRLRSGSGTTKQPNLAPRAGWLPVPDINLWSSGCIAPYPWLHITVPVTLPRTKYVSSDHIVIWLICRLCRTIVSFPSCFQICKPTNIRWVAVIKCSMQDTIGEFSKVTQRLLVGSQIWKWEVKDPLVLNDQCINHVTIRSELRYLKGSDIVRLKCQGFQCKTSPIAIVWVFVWWDPLKHFVSGSNHNPEPF